MTSPLFIYGTLQFPEVLQAVLLRVPGLVPAEAPGHRVVRLSGRVYPGLVRGDGAARGFLLTGLTPAERRILDDFEGPEYELRPLEITSRGGALAYGCTPAVEPLDADWSPEHFARTHLPGYATRCALWRRRLDAPSAGGVQV